jgi:hypothetical protein
MPVIQALSTTPANRDVRVHEGAKTPTELECVDPPNLAIGAPNSWPPRVICDPVAPLLRSN